MPAEPALSQQSAMSARSQPSERFQAVQAIGDFEPADTPVADLERLDLDLALDALGAVRGSATWSGRWLQSDSEPLALAAEGLEVALLQMNGSPADYTFNNGRLLIFPNHSPRRGLPFTVRIVYRSTTGFGFHSIPPGRSDHSQESGLDPFSSPVEQALAPGDEFAGPMRFSSFLPRSVRHWLPSPDTPSEHVTGTFRVLHDPRHSVVATGDPVMPAPFPGPGAQSPDSIAAMDTVQEPDFDLPGAQASTPDGTPMQIARFRWNVAVPVTEIFFAVGPMTAVEYVPIQPDTLSAGTWPAAGEEPDFGKSSSPSVRLHMDKQRHSHVHADSLLGLLEFAHQARQSAEEWIGGSLPFRVLDLVILEDSGWEQDFAAAGVIAILPIVTETPDRPGQLDFRALREQTALGIAAQFAGIHLTSHQWEDSALPRLLRTYIAARILADVAGSSMTRPRMKAEDAYPLIGIETVPPNVYETHSLTLLSSLAWQWSFLLNEPVQNPMPAIVRDLFQESPTPGSPRGSHSHGYFSEWASLRHGLDLAYDPQDQLSVWLEQAGINWDRMLASDAAGRPAPMTEQSGMRDTPSAQAAYDVDYTIDELAGRLALDFTSVGPPPDELITVRILPLPQQESEPPRVVTLSGAAERVEIEYAFWTETVILEAVDREGELVESVRFTESKPFEMWIGQLRFAPSAADRAVAAAQLSKFTGNPDLQLVVQEALLREPSAEVRAQLLSQLSRLTRGAIGTEEFFITAYSNALESFRSDNEALPELEQSILAMGAYPGNPRILAILESVIRDGAFPLELRINALSALHAVQNREVFLARLESQGLADAFVPGSAERVELIESLFELGEEETAHFMTGDLIGAPSQTGVRNVLRLLEVLSIHDSDIARWQERIRRLMGFPDPRIRYAAATLAGEHLSPDIRAELLADLLPEEYDARVLLALERSMP